MKFFNNIKKYNKYAVRVAKAELKSKVSDSYLNWLWWVIEPLCFMIIYTFVFGVVFKNNTPFFASFVFIGLTAWDFFNRMISGSPTLITNNRDLVSKVYLPKYILLLANSYIYLFKMVISFVLTCGLILFQGVTITWHILLIIPIFVILYIISFGLGLILMNYGVLFNDLSNLTNIGLKLVFYLSGIFYSIKERLNGIVEFLLLRGNPIAFFINELRKVLLYNELPSFEGLFFWLLIGILLCIFGVHLIHKNENSYAKVV